ncbi:ATP-binding protein [Mesonia aestuariivivens]|uniref:histidine kinase n=1 Tax=Mesonia aestuariivivens TaxID=2796128 RepID=A0ABS6W556_9FLAO|nr:ATP-binding protein [Mesonia aestuariivivens]MBW2962985.1 response regulator [Mesonia aestuariivivens]
MDTYLKKLFFLSLLLFSFQQLELKAQGDEHQLSRERADGYSQLMDSLHYNFKYFEYPEIVKQFVFISEVAEKNKDEELWLTSKFYTADIFYKANRNYQTQKILDEILSNEITKTSKKVILPLVLDLKVNVYLELGDVSNARLLFNEVSIEEKKSVHNYVITLTEAKLNFFENNYGEALRLLNSLEPQLSNYPNSYSLIELYLYKTKSLLALNKLDQANLYAGKAYLLSQKNGFTIINLKTTKLLARLSEQRANNSLQVKYLKQIDKVQDSIISFQNLEFTEERIADSKSIQSSVNTIKELSLTNSKQEKYLKFNKLSLVLSVLFIIILSLFTVSLYKNNNLRARANHLLQKKNADLVDSNEKVLAATRYREQFLSTITHELRTPIYAVTGLTYLLLKENPTKEQKEHLKSLKYSGEHLLSLINNILDINKLESNKISRVDFEFLFENQLNNTINALRRTAKENGVSVHLDIDKNIPNKLYGDMVKISQIIINLVGNAIKFSKNGDVWVRVRLENESETNVSVKFEVEDNGVGIPKDKHRLIFEKFNQGSDRINENYGGSGLGLSIVKNLLRFFKSEINLESEPGKGSKFYFTVAFDKVKTYSLINKPNPESEEQLSNQFDSPEGDSFFQGKRILVVEDNKLNQKITCKILEKKNLICEIANNGKEAVELVNKNTYDTILMDIHMPVMDGVEATKAIRINDKETPIIALTAVNISEELRDFLQYGFTDVIPKPYKTELFYDKIYKSLQSKHSPNV